MERRYKSLSRALLDGYAFIFQSVVFLNHTLNAGLRVLVTGALVATDRSAQPFCFGPLKSR
jgi:hypothetical protein